MKRAKATPPGQPTKHVRMTSAEQFEREREEAENDAKRVATQYARDREAEYPSPQEQLDFIVKYGIEPYRAMMQAIKDKYPKPLG